MIACAFLFPLATTLAYEPIISISNSRCRWVFEESFISDYENFSRLLNKAREFTINEHRALSQRWGGGPPYEQHYLAAEKLYFKLGFDPRKSVRARKILLALWLHDLIEDTPITKDQISRLFGYEIAELVDSVTKPSRKEEPDPLQRIEKSWQKLSLHPLSIDLKNLDTGTNVTRGLTHSELKPRYLKNYPEYRKRFKKPGTSSFLWDYLDSILLNDSVRKKFLHSPQREKGLGEINLN